MVDIHVLREFLKFWRCFGNIYVQWGSNQNVVFEFTMREISVLPTLKGSRELKNWYFTKKFLPQHQLYVDKTCTKFQGQNIYQKKDIQNLLTCVPMRKSSLLPTLTVFQELKSFFDMNFFHETIFMLKICVPNFKFKRFT